MVNGYTIIESGQKYGLRRGEEEVLPCVYDAIWLQSDALIGFRDDDQFGLVSVAEGRVIKEPIYDACFNYFPQYDGQGEEARFISDHGMHRMGDSIYIESVYHLIKKGECMPANFDLGALALIHDDGSIRVLSDDEIFDDYYMVLFICFFETKMGGIEMHRNMMLPFFSQEDRKFFFSSPEEREAVKHLHFIKYVDQVLLEYDLHKSRTCASMPKYTEYKYEAIPSSIIRACETHLSNFYNLGFGTHYELTRQLIFLSWLYANDFIDVFSDLLHRVDHRFAYAGPDENVYITYDHYQLQHISPMLKLYDTTQGYLTILSNLD